MQVYSPKWKQTEENHSTELKLESVPYISSFSSLLVANPDIVHTCKILQQIRKKTGCIQPTHDKSPFHSNPSLPKDLRDGITNLWVTKGITTFGNLFKDGTLQTFRELSYQYGPPHTHFFKYLQVRHFVTSEQGGRLQPLKEQPLDKLVRSKQGLRRFISYLYSGISQIIGWEKLRVKCKWEEDLECKNNKTNSC